MAAYARRTAQVVAMSDREIDLRRAEGEAAARESQVAEELQRLSSASGEVQGRLQAVKAAVAQAQLSGVRDPVLAEVHQRCQSAAMPGLSIDPARDRAMAAREQALRERMKAVESMRQAVQGYAAELSRMSSQLAADEATLENLAEHAQQEAAAAASRQAAAERAARERAARAAPAPIPLGRMGKPEGRRATPRVRMQAAIDLHSDTNFFNGFSTNISDGGLFIATVANVPLGTEVEVGFTLPSGQKIATTGVVRWVREVNDNTPEIFPGIGVQFSGLTPDQHDAIHQFVESRDPLFYPD